MFLSYLCNRIIMEDKYKYNSVVVAKYLVAYANDKKFGMNMTKLQKLLYIAYGIYLAVKRERLINEHPQAWPYGPVFPTTRNKLLKHDFSEIQINDRDFEEISNDKEIHSLLKLVFDTYGSWTGTALSIWSHRPNSPWDRTVNSDGFKWGKQMSDTDICEYFKSLLIPKK